MDGLEFNVSALLQGELGASHVEAVEATEPLELDGVTPTGISGEVRLTRTNFGILVRARLDGVATLVCDRCLDSYVDTLSVDFSEEYLPVIDVATGRPVQSERIDETFQISPNHIVDLTEAARQHILLAVPMHRLCREDCEGLCPTCGANKNTSLCDCRPESESPLSVLATLLSTSEPDC